MFGMRSGARRGRLEKRHLILFAGLLVAPLLGGQAVETAAPVEIEAEAKVAPVYSSDGEHCTEQQRQTLVANAQA